jgi:hypothetical protein
VGAPEVTEEVLEEKLLRQKRKLEGERNTRESNRTARTK